MPKSDIASLADPPSEGLRGIVMVKAPSSADGVGIGIPPTALADARLRRGGLLEPCHHIGTHFHALLADGMLLVLVPAPVVVVVAVQGFALFALVADPTYNLGGGSHTLVMRIIER